jgi:5'-3' exonuclease
VESLFWIGEYYHNGCCSWNWYYPYLYAPLASGECNALYTVPPLTFVIDLKNLSALNVRFTTGTPVTPFFQLLTVLPPQSNLMPTAFAKVTFADNSNPSSNNSWQMMKNPSNKIQEYFPNQFLIDPNGKKASWEGSYPTFLGWTCLFV